MSQPWIVMMPDNWNPEDCTTCGNYRHFCRERFRDDMECPYANAKKAVEASNEQIEIAGYMMSVTPGPIIDGKPVTLYAVEDEK